MLTWDRLRVFAAVVEHGSVTAAAEALHITGPAVSQHLRKLERETRCVLVEPEGRGIRLTTAGHALAVAARRVAATVADAERDLANLDGRIEGPLRIGGVATTIRTLVPAALRALTDAHPGLVPTMRDGEVVELLPLLRSRKLDVVIMEGWSHRPAAAMPPGVRRTDLVTEDVHLAVANAHRLADRGRVALADLAGEVWTSCPEGSEPYEALVQALRGKGVEPAVRYLLADFTTQMTVVAGGLAVALIPRMAQASAPPGVRFLPCDPAVTRTLSVVTTTVTTPAVRAFVAALADGG